MSDKHVFLICWIASWIFIAIPIGFYFYYCSESNTNIVLFDDVVRYACMFVVGVVGVIAVPIAYFSDSK